MNIAFFLTPKKDVVCQKQDSTMRQALERMEYHRYSAIPILDDDGGYVGTLTEGDLLWMLKNTPGLNFSNTSKILIKDIPRHFVNNPVRIDCDIDDLLEVAEKQSFVPVIDDNDKFIGIVLRSVIIKYCYEKMFKIKNMLNA